MSPKKLYSFWITEGQAAGLKAVQKVRDLSASEQIRRALDEWLDKNGVTHHKSERKRASTRKRS